MPLSEYIRRRKLSLAAIKLQSTACKVLDLAVQYGYDSADSFTRAFVKQHGVTPSAARQSGVNLTIFPPLTFQIKIEGVQAMNWRIEERKAFEVFGIERVFKNEESNIVPKFWDELMANGEYDRLCAAAGGQQGEDGVHCVNAICGHRETEGDTFPYMICALNKEGIDTNGYTVVSIPASTWAVFRSDKSDYMGVKILGMLNRAHSEWLPSSGYEKTSIVDNLEIYYSDHDGKFYEEVWLSVKKV
jgi:AraC family transcriptional regulator